MMRSFETLSNAFNSIEKEGFATDLLTKTEKPFLVVPEKKQESELLQSGGGFIRPDSQNFQITVNILVGIHRSLTSLIQLPQMKLDPYQFKRRVLVENEWITNKGVLSHYRFYDYAPLVF